MKTVLHAMRLDWAVGEFQAEEAAAVNDERSDDTLRVIRDVLRDHPEALVAVREALARKRREREERLAELEGGRLCVRCRGVCEESAWMDTGRAADGTSGLGEQKSRFELRKAEWESDAGGGKDAA